MTPQVNQAPSSSDSQRRKLRDAIVIWRREKALAKFSASAIHQFGPKMLLSDSQVDRILDCAPMYKIRNIEQLYKQTCWRQEWAEELGESLLEIIFEHFPPPPVRRFTNRPHVLNVSG